MITDFKEFIEYVISESPSATSAKEALVNNLSPDDIFDYETLRNWALENDFEESE